MSKKESEGYNGPLKLDTELIFPSIYQNIHQILITNN